jgi:hypothetical protein
MIKKIAALVIFAVTSAILPVIATVSASAQGKCWHCFVNAEGKKACHDDCSCQGKH